MEDGRPWKQVAPPAAPLTRRTSSKARAISSRVARGWEGRTASKNPVLIIPALRSRTRSEVRRGCAGGLTRRRSHDVPVRMPQKAIRRSAAQVIDGESEHPPSRAAPATSGIFSSSSEPTRRFCRMDLCFDKEFDETTDYKVELMGSNDPRAAHVSQMTRASGAGRWCANGQSRIAYPASTHKKRLTFYFSGAEISLPAA